MNVVAAVLAAGSSSRLGRAKQLALCDGEPLVSRALRAASGPAVHETAVVLGANAADVAAVVDAQFRRILNEQWPEGIGSSVRAAARWAQSRGAAALALVLVDQPHVDASHVTALLDAWRAGAPAAASSYAGTLGAPAVFDARLFPALLALRGDAGAAKVLRATAGVVAVPCEAAAFDVDTPAELAMIHMRA